MKNTIETVEQLKRREIARSATNRKTFSATALNEMKDSIREKGVVQPIIVRPVDCIEDEKRRLVAIKAGAKYELIAGERRWLGTELAEIDTIPAIVRKLSDFDALMIQTIENAQRENPPPLEEAEQYAQLLKMRQCDVRELASRTGKNRVYIYGRISLLRLPEKAREALREEKLSLTIALLLGRIPNPTILEEAAARILKGDWNRRPFTVAEAHRIIFEECMMVLKNAPFNTKDKTLVPEAGPCSLCPKRTGNEKELFADIGRADVCTDVGCFKAKCNASRERLLAQARTEGKTVISPEESAQILPFSDGSLSHDAPYVNLSKACPFARSKTWGEVIAKLPKAERPTIAVAADSEGKVHELVGRKEAGEVVRTLDLAQPGETRGDLSPGAVHQRKENRDARERHERTIRAVDLAITAVIDKQAKAKDTKALFKLLHLLALREANIDTARRVARRHGFVNQRESGDVRDYYQKVSKAQGAAPLAFVLETLLWHFSLFADRDLPEMMKDACKIYGIDTKKIEAAAKDKPAKASEPTLPALKK